jgi:hypothetical protein
VVFRDMLPAKLNVFFPLRHPQERGDARCVVQRSA